MAFTPTPLQDPLAGDPASIDVPRGCSFRQGSGQNEGADDLSRAKKRDLKKIVRSERSTHVPFDVEIARVLAVDRFPSRNSGLR
jgi:hypothetical protein